jgi:AcrR family transcriptional regulator
MASKYLSKILGNRAKKVFGFGQHETTHSFDRDSRRRRPLQSRARQTFQALQDAFVRLLLERSYAEITVREIVLVAGTGLGSFYEYFSGKEDLAKVCLHLRSKSLLLGIRGVTAAIRASR